MKRTTTILLILAALILAACSTAVEETTAPVVNPAETAYPGVLVVGMPTITPYYPAPNEDGSAGGVKPIYSYKPTTSDQNLAQGEVFLDLKASQILVMESMPVQVNVILKGELPTPCHELRVVPVTDEANKRVDMEVYTLTAISSACVAVLQPFEVTVELGSFSGGTYTVYANGEQLGEFDS
jgi:hypothetical protein